MATAWNGDVRPRTNGVVAYGTDPVSKPPTTTISTIAVQSGNTRIVIALLQSKEWIQLKIQEMQPSMTEIGSNVSEAMELNEQHEKVLQKLQTKQSPVEELLRQADELIATQKPRGEVYTAMAENLGLAWKDLNAQLEQRRQILEQAVNFFARSKDFSDALDRIQKNVMDTFLPDSADICSAMLQRHQEERKVALSCSMHMLKEGQYLLEKLCEVATHSMGDSRPFHMQHAARQTSAFVERHMEALHDQWRHLEALWTQRKLKLEQCLKRCQFLVELSEIQDWLSTKGAEYSRQKNLGDSSASAEILQHEHHKMEKDAKEQQDHALKLVKTAEHLAYSGNFAGEELKVKSYEVLSECSELLTLLENRNSLLSLSVIFFNSAQTALNKLDQIEVQLTTSEITPTASQQSHLLTAIEEITNPSIAEGRNLISRVDTRESGVQGVANKVAELEKRKKYLLDVCNAQKTENAELTKAFRTFNNNYEQLLSWLTNTGNRLLQQNREMGTTQFSAKNFVDQHESLQNDARVKGIEIDALFNSVPSLITVGGADAHDVLAKSENLRDKWRQFQKTLDKRISIAQCYVTFLKLATRVTKALNDVETDLKQLNESSAQANIRNIEEKLLSMQQEILQLQNSGRNFLQDAQKADDAHLNMAQPCSTVQSILDDVESRKLSLNAQWSSYQKQITLMKETLVQWEHLLKDSHRVIKYAKDLESKMFPIIPPELNRVESILSFLENRMTVLLPQIKSVQQEMDNFLKKSDVLCPRDKPKPEGQKVIEELQTMNNSFQKKLTDYQILISMMTTYFKNFEELDRMVELQESQFKMTILPNDVPKTESFLHEHKANKPTVMELFKFTHTEGEQVIKKINEAEPIDAAMYDKEKIISIYEDRKSKFETAWEEHRKSLERHLHMCRFNQDMQQINQQIADLNAQLTSMKQKYGDSLPNAITTSEAFIQFEKTIQILEVRIKHFVSTAEKMIEEEKVDTILVHKEILNMQNKWSTFQTQVSSNRKMIDLSIEYFKLIEESEEWLKEGSRILVSIARRSSMCRNVNEANDLNNEIKDFLNKGRNEQEERIRKISSLSIQLYGEKAHPTVQHVTNKNKDMLDSLTVIGHELEVLTENIKKAEIHKVKEAKEKEELDAALHAAQVEAEAAKAAAETAREVAKAAEAAAKAVPQVKEELKVAVPPSPPPRAHFPPKFIVPLHDAEVPEGTKFSFECRVEGYPEPEVQWFKDGILAHTNPDYQTKYENGLCVLTIEETFSEDTARFTCRAVNSAGTAETQGNLVVKETRVPDGLIPPHFIKEPSDATVMEGEEHQFQCQVSGNPLPLISWFKDDICIDSSPDYFLTYNNGNCILRLEETGIGHAGRYTCRAVNQAGQVACSVSLDVKTSLPSERPVFVTQLSNVMARAGQKLRLECVLTGQPEPQITWLHNSKAIKETRDIKMQFDGKNANLVITEAFPKDAGSYSVVARNKAGEAVSTCNVSVKGRLPLETSDSEMASDIEPAKPLVKQHLVDQTVEEGNKVRMDCIIVGQPEPEVIWYHNGKPVKESDDFQLLFEGDRCTLIIKVAYLEDAGTYRCVAINSGGEASSQCQLNVQSATTIAEDKSHLTKKDIILTVGNNPPKFIKLLKDVSASEGRSTKLECQVTGDGEISFKWFKDGIEITSSTDYELSASKTGYASIAIHSVKPHHGGSYSVTAQNQAGQAQSFCSLKVSPPVQQASTCVSMPDSPPVYLKTLDEVRVDIGKPARFECTVIGNPKPKVKWEFQGKSLTSDHNHHMMENGDYHSLYIPSVTKTDSGRYTVAAENNAGVAKSSALLHIEESGPPPEVYEAQTAQTMIMSKKSKIVEKCTITSMSEVDDSYDDASEPSVSEKIMSKTETKIITKPVIETYSSTVTSALESISIPPKFTKPVCTALVNEGEKLLLEGLVGGTPEPNIQWLKNGVEIVERPGLVISKTKGRPSIYITKALESDSGMYSCIASNTAGKATSVAEAKVKPHREPPKFLKALKAGVFKSGASINLEVEVFGIPTPEIKWYRNNAVLQSSPDFRITCDGKKHLLVIREAFPDDSGTFTVLATNAAGQAKCSADLIVEEDRSPEEEKIVTYQEISSVQQKREMFTKVSMAQSTSVPPYTPAAITADAQFNDAKPATTVPPKTPSPPPIPAVCSKVWSQTKPELITPKIEQITSLTDLPIEESHELPLVEFPEDIEQKAQKPDAATDATKTSVQTESFVKQTSLRFSEQKDSGIKKEEKPITVKTTAEKDKIPHVMQNGTSPMHVVFDSKQSTETVKAENIVSSSRTETTHSFMSSKSETKVSSSVENSSSYLGSNKEQSVTRIPVWKPSKLNEAAAEKSKPPPSHPFENEAVLKSADITHYRDIEVIPFSETGILTSAPRMVDSYLPKSSVTQQSYSSFRKEETITTKKSEIITEKSQVLDGKVTNVFEPKPIIKKETTKSDSTKPKKEVVIEEEPVVGAEVKPPVFSKVRGTESFWKIA